MGDTPYVRPHGVSLEREVLLLAGRICKRISSGTQRKTVLNVTTVCRAPSRRAAIRIRACLSSTARYQHGR